MSPSIKSVAPNFLNSMARMQPRRMLVGAGVGALTAAGMNTWNPGRDIPEVGGFFHEELNPVATRAMYAKYMLIGAMLGRKDALKWWTQRGPRPAVVKGRLFDLNNFERAPLFERLLKKSPLSALASGAGRLQHKLQSAGRLSVPVVGALTLPYVTGHTLTTPGISWMQTFLDDYNRAKTENAGGYFWSPVRQALNNTVGKLTEKAEDKAHEYTDAAVTKGRDLLGMGKEIVNEAVGSQLDSTLPPLAYNLAASIAAGIGAGALVPSSYAKNDDRYETMD